MIAFALISVLLGSTYATTTVEMLAGDSRFTTLVSLATKAGIPAALDAGNFTIFAPTNAAFAKLSNATLQALSDVNLLTNVLSYHAINGAVVMSTDVKNEMLATMANGGQARVNIYPTNNVVTIQDCNITQFDMLADNGVIHVIDTVMMQPTDSIVDLVVGNAGLTTLLKLVVSAGLVEALKADHLTVFAPTDAAFAMVPPDTLSALGKDTAALAAVLTYHVVNSTQFSIGLFDQEVVPTLNAANTLTVSLGAGVKINNKANVIAADVQATNGVVHLIDSVLLPADLQIGPVVGRR